ncbi:MAG: hypothetical protein C0592_11925 [Marinilabiliales bacterium]|nr:MAG: hypothetical protein C0592_11925 [Marinilabiliales bacterium]
MEKKETFKIKRETHTVSQKVKDQLKTFNKIRRTILEAIGEEEMNIPDIAAKIGMSKEDTMYYVMSLVKFNKLQAAGMDDMDEYYYYKIKE